MEYQVELSISFDESSSANGKIPLFNIDEYITAYTDLDSCCLKSS